MPKRFDEKAAREFVKTTLARPAASALIERHSGEGRQVATFALPLELCPPQNPYSATAAWKLAKLKTGALAMMLRQHGGPAKAPLPGRPRVLAVRFSSVAPDAESGWCKIPVDRLCMSRPGRRGQVRRGLGLLRDDRPALLDLRAWWEPAPPGHGCVWLEVWTGKDA